MFRCRFSVVIPLYNKSKQINRAVSSILAQTFDDYEIIVVDDGSTDDSVAVLLNGSAKHARKFSLLKQENAGPGSARNKGAIAANGEYIAFLDADDEWRPRHLELAHNALCRDPSCSAYISAYDTGQYQQLQPNVLLGLLERSGPWELPQNTHPADFKRFIDACHSSCLVIDKGIFVNLGGYYDKNRCTFGEDSYLMLQLILTSRLYFCMDSTVLFHVEDSELGAKRVGTPPIRPHLLDSDRLFKNSPVERLSQLSNVLAYFRLLEMEKFSWLGEVRPFIKMSKRYPWIGHVPSGLRLREIKAWFRVGRRWLKTQLM